MSKQKVIIIGSGLGGLACGVVLAKNGYDVTVLEQGGQVGGCLQCFVRRGVKFETGMHFIGSAAPGQTLYRLMNYLEIADKVSLAQLDPTGYDVVELGGRQFRFANGREAFIDTLAADFPTRRTQLAAYYDLVHHVAEASSLHTLQYAETATPLTTTYQLRSMDEVLHEVVGDELLENVLAGNLSLYAAERGKTPFSTHAFIRDFYDQSAFRVVGGSDAIATALCEVLAHYGGEVRTRSRVTKILCDDTHATGVEVNDEAFLAADIVISDAHPQRTLELLSSRLIRPAFRRRLSEMPQTAGVFAVYLHFRENAVPYMNHNFYAYRGSSPWGCEDYDDASWPRGFLYMHFCHELQPRWARAGVVLSYMNYDDVAQWENTRVGRRGEDYEAFKQRKAEQLIRELVRRFPCLAAPANIAHYYTSTPLTYRDYTGAVRGGMYGVAHDINLGAAGRVPQRTKVPNLLLTGQNVNSHGMLGTLVGTIVTCSELLTAREIYRQIGEAQNKAL